MGGCGDLFTIVHQKILALKVLTEPDGNGKT